MKEIKCLIVDDEPLAIDIIESYIDRLDFMKVMGKCSNGVEALSFLTNHEDIDLIFLDIQMPGLNGLQLFRSLKNPPKVVFTTAYEQFAVEGFELDALDYLIKPIPFERFMVSVNRFLKKQEQIVVDKQPSSTPEFIFVKSEKKMVKVIISEITYLESLRNYVIIHTTKGEEIATLNTIGNIETKLPESQFMRFHRSYIISLKYIESYSNAFITIDNKDLPIGRNYKEEVLNFLNNHIIE
ncbi:LytTR family DNA-binding domain-containing protein [Flammeovirga sp. EKP202]|uniref:LytR/AlgR family response regulator transcription factor n=1 Tax=Flammeovirga sp. EKP202 TaxID=2770592 RepID=UPI00165F44D6|nr:LytTR family DNA-binding domain-containing protein [Flammeovirga sp. EKP202]MBD0403696.1 response regulator transcription factor [Flammeovirga sp. EKP202]